MAYVLGFFTADGNMVRNKRGAHFIAFEITDKELLEIIRRVLGSNHKITQRRRKDVHKICYRLQIGSKVWFNDLSRLGLVPNKSKKVQLPKIPTQHFSHFVRGYFDGDGNVVFGLFKKTGRKRKSPVLLTRFTSGSELILKNLKSNLTKLIDAGGSLFYCGEASQLSYSTNDSKKLFNFMYHNGNIKNLIYLERKYNIYQKALSA